jgi:hypothetical protein
MKHPDDVIFEGYQQLSADEQKIFRRFIKREAKSRGIVDEDDSDVE